MHIYWFDRRARFSVGGTSSERGRDQGATALVRDMRRGHHCKRFVPRSQRLRGVRQAAWHGCPCESSQSKCVLRRDLNSID